MSRRAEKIWEVWGIVLIAIGLAIHGCGEYRDPDARPTELAEASGAPEPPPLRVLNQQVLQMERYGFAVLDFSARQDNSGVIYVLGEVRNNGSAARGVELQATIRDDTGRVIEEKGFWPASLENVEPGEVRPFRFPLGRHRNVAQIELQITRVEQWD